MISEFMLNIVFGIVYKLLEMLPEVTLSADTSAFSYFISFIRVAMYILPMPTVCAVVSLIFAFTVVRIVIAVIKTVWDLLPVV